MSRSGSIDHGLDDSCGPLFVVVIYIVDLQRKLRESRPSLI